MNLVEVGMLFRWLWGWCRCTNFEVAVLRGRICVRGTTQEMVQLCGCQVCLRRPPSSRFLREELVYVVLLICLVYLP
jgi:hypothetical protein